MSSSPTATFHINLIEPTSPLQTSEYSPSSETFARATLCPSPSQSTRESWKFQLLGLIREAPQPSPVLCNEPRRFPHFGKSRASESSWTSFATCSTDVPDTSVINTSDNGDLSSHSSPPLHVDDDERKSNKKNSDQNPTDFQEGLPSLSPQSTSAEFRIEEDFDLSNNMENLEWTYPPGQDKNAAEAKGNGADYNPSENVRASVKRESRVKNETKEISSSKVSTLLTLNSTATTLQQEQGDHQVRRNTMEKKPQSDKSRQNVSLSIIQQRDSDYWEKFRYSKDYQSSLMIETICNEVFNLKPSPRYKNLMKLSQKNKGSEERGIDKRIGIGKLEKEQETTQGKSEPEASTSSSQHNLLASNEEKFNSGKIVIDRRKSIPIMWRSPRITSNNKEFDIAGNYKLGRNNRSASFQDGKNLLHHDRNKGKNINGNVPSGDETIGNNDQGKKDEYPHHQLRSLFQRKQSYISTSSSVFTVTTRASGEEEEEEEDGKQDNEFDDKCKKNNERLARMMICEGFGLSFHGYLTRRESESLLKYDGQYLVRQIWKEDCFILSFRFDGEVLNYRINCEPSMHENDCLPSIYSLVCDSKPQSSEPGKWKYCLEDQRSKWYSSLDELVGEGLLTLHLDENAGSYIDLLLELAQFERDDNLLQSPASAASGSTTASIQGLPGSRKASRVASFRKTMVSSSSTASSPTSDRNSKEIALRIHFFEEEIVNGSVKCRICLKRFSSKKKCLMCRDCGVVVHESCIDKVTNECQPDLGVIPPFSSDLTTLVKGSCKREETGEDSSYPFYEPPYILVKCINEIKVRGIETEGIYRVSGSVEEIEILKNLFERDKTKADLSNCEDFHAITSLVKFFLRQLPDPLITKESFEEYSANSSLGEVTKKEVQMLILCLPPAHKITLKYLLEHWNDVTKEKALNKMNAFNIASVLLPSILCPDNIFDVLESGTNLLSFLITHVNDLKF